MDIDLRRRLPGCWRCAAGVMINQAPALKTEAHFLPPRGLAGKAWRVYGLGWIAESCPVGRIRHGGREESMGLYTSALDHEERETLDLNSCPGGGHRRRAQEVANARGTCRGRLRWAAGR